MAEAICLVIDVGVSASQKPPDGKSFLDAALECSSLFVERKLFAETKDEIGIILFGTEETKNQLDYENITVLDRGLVRPDWDTVSFLREHVKGTEVESDWIDALVVALDFLKEESEGKKFNALKIVLFSDLGCSSNNDQMEVIVQGMKKLDNVDFTHIGPDWLSDEETNGSQPGGSELNASPRAGPSRGEPEKPKPTTLSQLDRKPKTKVQKLNEEIVSHIVAETDGTMCSLDDALAIFLYKNKRGKKPWPWKVLLEIGPEIKVSITGYVKVRRENPKTWKSCLAADRGDNIEELKPETTFIRNNEDQEVVEPEDLVVSYRYGNEQVNITEEEEAAYKFDGGPKSMSVFGFINREEIQITDLVGNGCMAFLPTEGDQNSASAIAALTRAMQELGMVAIVRKVYNKASAPRLGVLAPEEDENGELILVFAELPFQEDRRELQFANLLDENNLPSDEQVSAVDDLIDGMMLDAESLEEDGDAGWQVTPEEMMNPGYQYLFQSLAYRALYPTRPLPEIPNRLRDCMEPPTANLEAVAPVIDRIRELFPLEVVLPKKAKRTGNTVFGDQNGADNDDDTKEPEAKRLKAEDVSVGAREVTHVGSTSPVEDFRYLLSHQVTSGYNLESAGLELEGVITRLIASAFGNDLNPKIISCLEAYREECRNRENARIYNEFIKKVKEIANKQLWQDIISGRLGLLTKTEIPGGVGDAEAESFASEDDGGQAGAVAAEAEEEEEEDMMDLL